MYHGTAGGIKGGVIRPSEGDYGFGAYATDNLPEAEEYAKESARREVADGGQQRLFAAVHKVQPTSEAIEVDLDPEVYEPGEMRFFRDPKGMKSMGEVSWKPMYDLTRPGSEYSDAYNDFHFGDYDD